MALVPVILDYLRWVPLPTFFIETLFLLSLSTLLIVVYLLRSNSAYFSQLYLLTVVVKLIALVGFVFWMLYDDYPNAIPNIVFFLICYVVFTAAEVIFLYEKITRR